MQKNFIPGLELCGYFYSEIIKRILDLNFPDIRYSAVLIGAGFEALGFDTEMCRDHDWGPRVKFFLIEFVLHDDDEWQTASDKQCFEKEINAPIGSDRHSVCNLYSEPVLCWAQEHSD